MYVAGTKIKQMNLSGISGRVSSNGKYLVLEDKNNALFGSNLTMDRAFENLLNLLSRDMAGIWYGIHPAWDFEKALCATAQVYSGNPCDLTGLSNQGWGYISDGGRADICILDITGTAGQYRVNVEYTIVDGNIAYQRS